VTPSIALDASVRRYDGGRVLVGGGGRILRLSEAGVAALDALLAGGAEDALARRLVEAGVAHPVPRRAAAVDVTIVVPVRDRADALDRCLAGAAHPVIVVDDGSADAAAIAAVCARHGARTLRRDSAGGPGAARNHALRHVTSELVAFLDSDCVAPPGWVEALAGHFGDPRVAAVAPRVLDRALDMGGRPAAVAPGGRVPYVPGAALVVRRAALGPGFDAALRYGEDVDLVWRLRDRGWRVRYDPRVTVRHDAPHGMIARRFRYGTSAAPLALRHPGRLAPLVLRPAPALVLALALARRPAAAAAVLAAQSALLARRLRGLGVPARLAPAWTLRAVAHTLLGVFRAAGHPAYRAGVLYGAVRHRTAAPLLPQLNFARPAAISSAPRRWRRNRGSE
jgi:mycofactocin system glycosyltransferase